MAQKFLAYLNVPMTTYERYLHTAELPTINDVLNSNLVSNDDFANAICEIYNDVIVHHGGESCKVNYTINPISTDSLGAGVNRPRVVMLSKEKIVNTYNVNIPYWRDSLKNVIEKLVIYGNEEFNL